MTVTNTGNLPGADIAQLYIEMPQDGLHRPLRELRGFRKIWLKPGEHGTVSFDLTDRDFSIWQNGWIVPSGNYTIRVGGSSRELPLRQTLRKDGVMPTVPVWQNGSFYETCAGMPTQAGLEAAVGRKYTLVVPKKGEFTMDNTVMEMKDHSLIMKIMFKAVESTVSKGFGGKKDYGNPDFRMMMASSAGSPLRSMQISGGMKGGVLPGMLEMANGHFLRGILRMIRG